MPCSLTKNICVVTQSQEKVARIRCGLTEWRRNHTGRADLPPRISKVLSRAEEHISLLTLDAGVLINISRSITLNVTLPTCSRGQRRGFLVSSPSQFDQTSPESPWDLLHVLRRSLQQASQNVFFDVTELTLGCDEIQSLSHSDQDVLLHEGSDLVTLQGQILHLERTVATMQVELHSLETAQREAHEQASRLQAALEAAQLPAQQQELCCTALASLQRQQDMARAKAARQRFEMGKPQQEIARLRAMLANSKMTEGAVRRKLTRDIMLRDRCSLDLRALRHGAGVVARHSDVLTYLVDYQYRL